jgi:hypothetical protein
VTEICLKTTYQKDTDLTQADSKSVETRRIVVATVCERINNEDVEGISVILWGQMHNWVTAKITEFLSLK